METNQKKLISAFVRNGRLAKGLTQKELSERTNISIRSIQRIENAELVPRSYTLKTIAAALGISLDTLPLSEINKTEIPGAHIKSPSPLKVILSIGLSLVIVFLAAAFIFQSPRFPETQFEGLLFWAAVTTLLTAVLFLIWKKR